MRQGSRFLFVAAAFALVSVPALPAGTSARVIPWRDEIPAVATAAPALAPPCASAALRARHSLGALTGGMLGGTLIVTNVGSRVCSLVGTPRLSLAGAAAGSPGWKVTHQALSLAGWFTGPLATIDLALQPLSSLRSLKPGRSAAVWFTWNNWCGPGAQADDGSPGRAPRGLVFGAPGGGAILIPVSGGRHLPRCLAPTVPSQLDVFSTFLPAPLPHPPRSSRLPLSAAIVTPKRPAGKATPRLIVHRGRLFRFEVTLTNTGATPFSFHDCPIYEESLLVSVPRPYVLDCRGTGPIAPGASVTFAMQLSVPPSARLGNAGILWELAPRTYDGPVASAAVRVVP